MNLDHLSLMQIAEAWRWSGVNIAAVEDVNSFGHAIVRDVDGHFWHLDPDMCELEALGNDRKELARAVGDEEFQELWQAKLFCAMAVALLGQPDEGRCYYFVIPAVLGGQFSAENMKTIPIAELLIFAGDLGRQISDLPDGAQVQLKVID